MLGKMLKYDLKWIYKVIVVFYILAFVFSILTRLFSMIDNSMLFMVVSKICGGFVIGMLINGIINCVIRSWVRFVTNIYKDEAYLTHTLPISKGVIYSSKILASIICTFTTILVIVVCLFISYYSKENLELVKGFLELAANTYDTTVVKLLLSISVVIFLEILFILLVGYVGIIIGHRYNNKKMFKSIFFGFGLYLLTSSFSLAIICIIGLFNPNVMDLIQTVDVISLDTIKLLMIICIVIYTIYNFIYYFIGKWLFEKGINID